VNLLEGLIFAKHHGTPVSLRTRNWLRTLRSRPEGLWGFPIPERSSSGLTIRRSEVRFLGGT
jgi:hypothetical protein